MRIFKYAIQAADEFTVEMPRGARLLSVQAQLGDPQLWAMVDPDAPKLRRKFCLRRTGRDATGLSDAAFIGTFQLNGGHLVFHLFDLGEIP